MSVSPAPAPSTRAPGPLSAPPPAPVDNDVILGRFLDYVAGLGLELYPAQEEAVFEVLAGKHLILTTPTGSGKSLVATAFLWKAFAEGKTGFWSCPVKALVNEKFFDLCAAFGAENVGLLTGDASVNRDARILCGTAEVLANMAVRSSRSPADYVVMDEFHYYADRERGIAWQLPLITLKDTTFLLMSATLGDTTAIERNVQAFTGREVAVVRAMTRPVPLDFEYRETALHETIAELVRTGRAPIYLVNFTQRAAAEEVQNLMSLDLSSKAEKDALKLALKGERFASPYGKEIQKFLRHGLGLHHAGLLPRYRRLVERLAQKGLLKVVSGTDTLGVGVNIPIRTVLFTQLCKYDGEKDVLLSVREFKQIAGRAGRKGFDERGWVAAQAPAFVIENKKLAAKAATGKKVHKQKPPDKGYVHFDKGTFDRLAGGVPEPLESRFAVSHALLLSLLQGERGDPRRGGGYRVLLEIIEASHDGPPGKRRSKRAAAQAFRTLRRAGLVEVRRDERARNPYPMPHESLQHDFSLHHTLSLYLIETLGKLDPALETYPLDVLTLVESILENPRPVLQAQLSRVKDQLVAEMKAAGVEYEERMEKLEQAEWPKPLRDFIYETFNDFSDRHPWVGNDNIAPKSVAREIIERFCSFHDYIRDYGLQRVEGILLRYLSDAYRGIAQSVPAKHRSPEVDDVTLTLASLVRGVDASLLEEWQALRDPSRPQVAIEVAEVAGGGTPLRGGPADLLRDPRALAARIRTDMHRLLGALARKDYEDALLAIRAGEDPGSGDIEWTVDKLSAALAPFHAEHARILTTPAARAPRNTLIQQEGDRRWRVQQRLIAAGRGAVTAAPGELAATGADAGEEGDDWAIHAVVDLTAGVPEDGPLIALERVGV
jgi:superfamily II RNA helicase